MNPRLTDYLQFDCFRSRYSTPALGSWAGGGERGLLITETRAASIEPMRDTPIHSN